MAILKNYKLKDDSSIILPSPAISGSGTEARDANVLKGNYSSGERKVVIDVLKTVREAPVEQAKPAPTPTPDSRSFSRNAPPSTSMGRPSAFAAAPVSHSPTAPATDLNAARKELETELNARRAAIDKEVKEYRELMFTGIDEEKEAITKKAYDEGYNKGLKNLDATLAEKSAEILQTVNDAIKEKNKILKKARGEVLRLAMKVAEQILKSEISLNQAVCVNIVAEAIGKITDKDKVIVRVNRADADFVKLNKDRFLKQMEDIKNLIIQEDSRVEPGGCIIETELGYIDSTISTKLESIEKALFRVYEEEERESEDSEDL